MTESVGSPEIVAANPQSELNLLRDSAQRSHYDLVNIPKIRSVGGVPTVVGQRRLSIPCDALKRIQYDILDLLKQSHLGASSFAHAYIRHRSIVTAATPHVGHRYLLKIDLKDFFPSINDNIVDLALRRGQAPAYLRRLVKSWCFLFGGLPQGAPTSPFLSNLAAGSLDMRIGGLLRSWRRYDFITKAILPSPRLQSIIYTRYADDLIFSSEYPQLWQLRNGLFRIIRDCGFQVNPSKVSTHKAPSRLSVVGVVVNEKLSTKRSYRKTLRSRLHRIVVDRLHNRAPEGMELNSDRDLVEIQFNRLQGQLAHVKHVQPSQGASLASVWLAAVEVHTLPETEWSTTTNDYKDHYGPR
jgi:RNA-directed DNA polymerase